MLLLKIGQLFAQEAPANPLAGAEGGKSNMMSLLMFAGIFVVFYLLMVLPEQRRRKKLKEEISALKKGDKVLTSGGIVGEIDFIDDKKAYIKTQDAKIEILKDYIVTVIRPTDSNPTK